MRHPNKARSATQRKRDDIARNASYKRPKLCCPKPSCKNRTVWELKFYNGSSGMLYAKNHKQYLIERRAWSKRRRKTFDAMKAIMAINHSKGITGGVLAVTDKDGNIVNSWTSHHANT